MSVSQRPVGRRVPSTPQSILAAVFVACFVITACGGGSSRPDVAALMVVRIAAVSLFAATMLLVPAVRLARVRNTLIFSGFAATLMALQLVPLPPSVWTALPGRDRYTFDAIAGLGAVWRPLSLTPDLTINSLLSILPPLAATLWARVAGSQGRRIALYAIVAAAGVSAVLGLAQLATGANSPLRYYPITNADSAVGLFANRNHQGMFLAISIPLLALWAGMAGRINRETGPAKSLTALGVAGFVLAMAALTDSRASLLLAAVTGVFALVLYRQLKQQWPAPKGGATNSAALKWIPLGAVVTMAMLLAALSRTVAFERITTTDPLNEQRAMWIKPLTEMVWKFAPAGAGFGSFDSVFRGFEPFELLQLTYLNAAHNDLLQLVIEGGIGAAALLIVFLLWWGRCTYRLWVSPPDDDSVMFGRAGSVMTGSILIASLFDYPLRTPIHAVVFAIATAWMWREQPPAVSGPKMGLPSARD